MAIEFEKVKTTTLIVYFAGGLVTYLVVQRAREEFRRRAEDLADSFDPTDADNIFNQAANKTGEAVTGQKGWTLGGWLYDVTHPDAP